MRILQINALYGSKSTGGIVKDIHKALLGEGIDSRVVCVRASERELGVTELGYGIDGRLHALMTRLNGKQGFYSGIKTKRLLRELEKDKPDIIHIHNLHSNFINLPGLFEFAARNGIPVMMTLHDAWYFTGKCYHFLDNGCDRWKSGCYGCPKKNGDIPSILDKSSWVFEKKKRMYSSVDLHVVGCSKWITECAKASPLFSGASFYQIYNGVDTAVFNPEAAPLGEDPELCRFTVLTMANKWFDAKNKRTREAVLGLLREISGRLVIVGCTPEQMAQRDDGDSVEYVGYITDRGHMASLYRSADAFLNLTLVDTLPTVNIESAMCATPIVTYASGGSGELVLQGQTGYAVPPLDTDGVISALREVFGGKIRRERCAEWASSEFDKTKNYRKYIDLYRKIHESKGKD